jgi:hypothetical protein
MLCIYGQTEQASPDYEVSINNQGFIGKEILKIAKDL